MPMSKPPWRSPAIARVSSAGAASCESACALRRCAMRRALPAISRAACAGCGASGARHERDAEPHRAPHQPGHRRAAGRALPRRRARLSQRPPARPDASAGARPSRYAGRVCRAVSDGGRAVPTRAATRSQQCRPLSRSRRDLPPARRHPERLGRVQSRDRVAACPSRCLSRRRRCHARRRRAESGGEPPRRSGRAAARRGEIFDEAWRASIPAAPEGVGGDVSRSRRARSGERRRVLFARLAAARVEPPDRRGRHAAPRDRAQPRRCRAHCNLGSAYYPLAQWSEMEAAFAAALARNPNMRLASQGLVSTRLGRLLYDHRSTPAEIFAAHRAWGETVAADAAATPAAPFLNPREPDRRLRIGYVSGDLYTHPVAQFLLPLLARHDPQAVEVFCYAELERTDAITEQIRRFAAGWRETNALDDAALAAQFRADRIDILIDIAGHTARNRLQALAVKSAPVTATWLGYPTTTGLRSIDWRITDAIADPPGAEDFHTERLWRLPDGFLCYAPQVPTPPVAPPPSAQSGAVTFGSFNTPMKLSAATVESWAAILRAV